MAKLYLANPKSTDAKIGNFLGKFSNKVRVYPPGTCQELHPTQHQSGCNRLDCVQGC